jgi:aspartate--ammonia ligase
VDAKTLKAQLAKAGCEDRKKLPFHQMLLNHELPLTIGGGIGQSRICLLLLNKAHIGEVQVSQWDDETIEICRKNHIHLL